VRRYGVRLEQHQVARDLEAQSAAARDEKEVSA
jgi:hypothetical protein